MPLNLYKWFTKYLLLFNCKISIAIVISLFQKFYFNLYPIFIEIHNLSKLETLRVLPPKITEYEIEKITYLTH